MTITSERSAIQAARMHIASGSKPRGDAERRMIIAGLDEADRRYGEAIAKQAAKDGLE